MQKASVGWLAWVTGAIALAGCSSEGERAVGAVASATNGAERAVEARRVGGSETESYSFFVATREDGRYRVAAINGAPFACGWERATTSCTVATIDLSVLDLAPANALVIRDQIGRDPEAPTLLFVGVAVDDTLAVQEVWRAPAAVPIPGADRAALRADSPSGGAMLLVSHQPGQALVVNTWATALVGALDFTRAPQAELCVIGDAGQACTMSYVPVTTDVVSPAGVVLTGETGWDGTLHVQQYFLKISTGFDDDGDGYSYCAAGQMLCPNNACSYIDGGGCNAVHWGGRGEKPEVTIYQRSGSGSVDAWLLATGQLQPADLQ